MSSRLSELRRSFRRRLREGRLLPSVPTLFPTVSLTAVQRRVRRQFRGFGWLEGRAVPAGAVITILLAALIAGLFHRFSHTALDVNAMDCAQVGRQIAAGHGFTTQFLRPFALSLKGYSSGAPDVTNAPLYPLVLGAAFAVLPVKDLTVAGVSLTLFVLAVGLLFLLAYRLSGKVATAALASAFFGLSGAVLQVADTGGSAALTACLFLSMLLVLTPKDTQGWITEGQLFRQFFLAGVLASLTCLASYEALFLAAPAAIIWAWKLKRWEKGSALAFLAGLILPALFWMVRNLLVAGNPFYSLQWLHLATGTTRFPGQTLLRDTAHGSALTLELLAPQPGFLPKLGRGLFGYYYPLAVALPEICLAPFVVVSFLRRAETPLASVCRSATWPALLVGAVGFSALGRTGASSLLPVIALLAFLGTSCLSSLALEWGQARAAARLHSRDGHHPLLPELSRRFQSVVLATALLLAVLQLSWQIASSRKPASSYRELAAPASHLPAGAVVATDIPWAVAWYADRPTVWIPVSPDQIEALPAAHAVGALYLSPALPALYGADEQADAWKTIFSGRPEIKGFRRTTGVPREAVLYTRLPSEEQARRTAAAHPQDAAAWEDLGRALLEEGRDEEALSAYHRALALRPGWTEAALGCGDACLNLKRYGEARQQFAGVLQSAPRDVTARFGLAECDDVEGHADQAIQGYEAVLADAPNQPVVLNNLAFLYARSQHNLNRATELAARAVAAQPDNSSMRDTLGWVYLQSGRYQEALAELEMATRLPPVQPMVWFHLGKALQVTGHAPEARQAFQRALDAGLTGSEAQEARQLR